MELENHTFSMLHFIVTCGLYGYTIFFPLILYMTWLKKLTVHKSPKILKYFSF